MSGYNIVIPDICKTRAPEVTLPLMDALQQLGHTPVLLNMPSIAAMYQQIRNQSHGCYEIFQFYVADLMKKGNIDMGISVGLASIMEDPRKNEAHNLLEELHIPQLLLLPRGEQLPVERIAALGMPDWRHTYIACATASGTAALQTAGVEHAFHLPPAMSPRLFYPATHRPENSAYPVRQDDPWLAEGYAVSFVGTWDSKREEYLLALAQAGIELAIWGDDAWGKNPLLRPYYRRQAQYLSDVNTIYNSSRINLDLPRHEGMPQDYISQRLVDCLASHGFLATWRRDGLKELFEPEHEVAVFGDPGELLQLVRYYLEHEGERHRLATRANGRMLKEFTWERRLGQALPRLEMHMLTASVA
jgi:hypothetical protein